MLMIVIRLEVRKNKKNEFDQWLKKLEETIKKFPGFLSQTISVSNTANQSNFILTQNFDSSESAKSWLQSQERSDLHKTLINLINGMDNVSLFEEEKQENESVTAIISTFIDPKNEQKFLEWQSRITPMQSKFKGFLGYKLEKPKNGLNNNWITIITFDNDEHLESWLSSNERKRMIEELNQFSTDTQLQKVSSGFNFWFHLRKSNDLAIKENMLVLLTLYPVVILLTILLNPIITCFDLPLWFSLFISNALSTITLGFVTVPLLMKIFSWWLNPKKDLKAKYNFIGVLLVCFLYLISMYISFLLLKKFFFKSL